MATRDLTAQVKVELELGLIVRPGDTLIIALAEPHSREEIEDMGARIKAKTGVTQVMFLDGVTQLAAYRPDQLAEIR